MKQNVGTIDRVLRAVIGIVLLTLAFTAGWSTLWTALAAILGLVMLGVAITRSCPIYSIFGLRTCPISDKP